MVLGGEGEGQLGEKSGFADARLAGEEIDPAFGETRPQNTIKLTDARGKGVAGLGGKGGFDRETFGRLEGDLLTGFGSGCFEERGGFDERIPLVAGRALAGPLGKLVAATVTEKDGGRFHILYCTFYISPWISVCKYRVSR